jgi:DNA repair protein RecO (recombination protein O)
MMEVTKYLGFYPDLTELDFPYFDIKEGYFTPFQSINSLTEHETHLFKRLLQLKFDSDQKIFAGIERQLLLKILLDFFTLHLDGFKKPKSLDVLTEVFS